MLREVSFGLILVWRGNVFGMIPEQKISLVEETTIAVINDRRNVVVIDDAGPLCLFCHKPVDEEQVREVCCFVRQLCASTRIKCLSCAAVWHQSCFDLVYFHPDDDMARAWRCFQCQQKLSTTCMDRYIRWSGKHSNLLMLGSSASLIACLNFGMNGQMDGVYAGLASGGAFLMLSLPGTPLAIREEFRGRMSARERCGACTLMVGTLAGIVITFLVHLL